MCVYIYIYMMIYIYTYIYHHIYICIIYIINHFLFQLETQNWTIVIGKKSTKDFKNCEKSFNVCFLDFFFLLFLASEKATYWKWYCDNSFPGAWSTTIQPKEHSISLPARLCHCESARSLYWQCLLQVTITGFTENMELNAEGGVIPLFSVGKCDERLRLWRFWDMWI